VEHPDSQVRQTAAPSAASAHQCQIRRPSPSRSVDRGLGSPSKIRGSSWPLDGVPSPEQPLKDWPERQSSQTGHPTRWFDVDPACEAPALNDFRGRDEPAQLRDNDEPVFASLSDVLGTRLTLPMVNDLRRHEPHLQSRVETYGDEDGPRFLSMAAAVARDGLPECHGSGLENMHAVVFQEVRMLADRDWIITCWHPSRTVTGAVPPFFAAPLLRQPFLRRVQHLRSQEDTTASDLGLCLALALVDTYGATHRLMQGWVADWEVDIFNDLAKRSLENLKDAETRLDGMLATAAEARRRITGLQHARAESRDRSWLLPRVTPEQGDERPEPHPRAKVLADRLEHHETAFKNQTEAIRANMDVVMLRSTAAQQEISEALQRRLGVLTSLVLAPTLIVGLFGANTALPGGGTWWGFSLMILLMALSILIAAVAWRFRDLTGRVRERRMLAQAPDELR
jgi:hypothetical protein